MTSRKQKNQESFKKGMKTLVVLTQTAISMIVPIVLCIFAGMWIDKKANTGNIWTMVFIILGIGAAFRNTYFLLRQFTKGVNEEDDKNK